MRGVYTQCALCRLRPSQHFRYTQNKGTQVHTYTHTRTHHQSRMRCGRWTKSVLCGKMLVQSQ